MQYTNKNKTRVIITRATTTLVLNANFQNSLGRPVPECETIPISARDEGDTP